MPVGEVKTLLFADGVPILDPTPVQSAKTLTDATGWNGTSTVTVTYDVSSLNLPDARDATWFFKDDTYTQIGAKVTPTDATHVTVTVGEVIPAGTYYLTGVY